MGNEANYLYVNISKKQFFDPAQITGCLDFSNFLEFHTVGKIVSLLLAHNSATSHDAREPAPYIHHLIGSWAGDKIAVTGRTHNGKEFTGNFKVGNLHAVAVEKFTDISAEVCKMEDLYSRYCKNPAAEKPKPPSPKIEVEEKPNPSDPIEIVSREIKDNLKFTTYYQSGIRHTAISERLADGSWQIVADGPDD